MLLLAARFGIPVCPHAGGVGLCEYVQHASIFDHIAVSRTMEGRVTEYVDQLHEHFVSPVRVEHGRYLAPTAPGSSIELEARVARGLRVPGRAGLGWPRSDERPARIREVTAQRAAGTSLTSRRRPVATS